MDGQFSPCEHINPIHDRMSKKMQFVTANGILESHDANLKNERARKNQVFMTIKARLMQRTLKVEGKAGLQIRSEGDRGSEVGRDCKSLVSGEN